MADAAPIHLLLLDTNEQIVFANKAMLDWWKLSREEVTGKCIRDIVGEEAQRVLHAFTKDVLDGGEVSYEAPFLRGSSVCYFHNTYLPFKDHDGRIKGFIATGINITEQENLKLKLKELENKI